MTKVIAKAYGMEYFDVLTGFKYIGEKIKAFEETGSHTYVFGFEESYG
jgi:phosphoglucomutase